MTQPSSEAQPAAPQAASPGPTPSGPTPLPNPLNPAGSPGAPTPPAFPPQAANGDNGFPEHTPVAQMTPEQQIAYWRFYARRNEDRIKSMGDYTQLKEQAEAYQKLLEQTQTEQEKAVMAAEQRGRSTALAEAGSQMVEAYVRAASTGRLSEEQVTTLLQGLDRTRFVNPATGQVDAQMISQYVAMLAPGVAYAPAPVYAAPVPATGAVVPQPGSTLNAAASAPVPQLTYPGQPQPWGVYPPQAAQPTPAGVQPVMGDGRQVPNYGQAQYPQAAPSGYEAGRAIAQARYGKK